MKKLIYAVIITLVITSLVTGTQARNFKDAQILHFRNSAAIPNNSHFQYATQQVEVYVQGIAFLELSIDLPESISIREGIEVKNQ